MLQQHTARYPLLKFVPRHEEIVAPLHLRRTLGPAWWHTCHKSNHD
jgi:hypothetical protein